MNALRNLYRIKNADGKVLALVTSADDYNAIDRYTLETGDTREVSAEQISHGYPEEMLKIF